MTGASRPPRGFLMCGLYHELSRRQAVPRADEGPWAAANPNPGGERSAACPRPLIELVLWLEESSPASGGWQSGSAI